MSISFVHLRRALFATSCAIVFGFGATQALAAPESAGECNPADPADAVTCDNTCRKRLFEGGICSTSGSCLCYM